MLGPTGVGKSRLVAEAILHGGQLIADDQVLLLAHASQLMAESPAHIAGIIELRGLGLMRVETPLQRHPLHCVITLDAKADSRLPEAMTEIIHGITLPHLRVIPPPNLAVPSLLLYLEAMRDGRTLPTDWHPLGA